ncbi:MAG: hypothetical protein OEL76_14125 [Siculibacillus sp.]|nr:hypothetical protein [Siculibacillus sp.]
MAADNGTTGAIDIVREAVDESPTGPGPRSEAAGGDPVVTQTRRGTSMQEMIERIATQVGIDPSLAHKATSMIVDFIVANAPTEHVDTLRQFLPGLDDVAAQGASFSQEQPEEGGGLMGALGGLMGGSGIAGALGGLMGGSQGGGLGGALALLGNLQKDGLDFGQVQSLAGGLLGELRSSAGDDVVDKLVAEIPGIGKFIG